MFNSVAGIDVSKDKLDVALLIDKHYHQMIFDNTPAGHRTLVKWLRKQQPAGGIHACMEATGMYGEASAEHLHQFGYAVSVVNPARIKAYADSQLVRNKTDRSDARVIADFCRAQEPSVWSPPDPTRRELRSLMRLRQDLMSIRQQERNRRTSGETSLTVLKNLRSHIEFLNSIIKTVEKQIRTLVASQPELKRLVALLVTIQAIGFITACTVISEIQDITLFDNVRQLVAYAGLSPSHFVSGSSVHRKARLSKKGNAVLRTALFLPAMVAKRYNPILSQFSDRLAIAGKSPMSVTGAVMRKLLHILFGVWKSGLPFDPDHLQHSLNFA
jgi:transposase